MLKAAKHKAAKTRLKIKIIRFKASTLRAKVNITGIIEIATPKMKDENISPKRIAQNEIGQHTSLSKVFERVSQGIMEGPTEVEVKNTVILINPGINSFRGIFLPIVYARKRKSGNIKPKIMTGPFE